MKKLFAFLVVVSTLFVACTDNTHADETKMRDSTETMSAEPSTAPDTASMKMDSAAIITTDTVIAK